MDRGRGFSKFIEISYLLLGPQRWTSSFLGDISPLLKKAGIYIAVDVYAAAVAFAMLLGMALGALIAFAISLLHPTPLGALLFTIAGLVAGAALGLISMLLYPRAKALERKLKLADEMPYTISHMATLAAAGTAPERMFMELAKGDPREVTTEQVVMIMRDIKLLGKDIISAIDNAIARSPNPEFSRFLQGFKAAIASGRDVAAYLTDYASGIMAEKRITIKMLSETLALFSEIYTVLLIALPIAMVIMLTLMAALSPRLGGFSITDILFFITYVVVPLFGAMFLLLIDAMMPKR